MTKLVKQVTNWLDDYSNRLSTTPGPDEEFYDHGLTLILFLLHQRVIYVPFRGIDFNTLREKREEGREGERERGGERDRERGRKRNKRKKKKRGRKIERERERGRWRYSIINSKNKDKIIILTCFCTGSVWTCLDFCASLKVPIPLSE